MAIFSSSPPSFTGSPLILRPRLGAQTRSAVVQQPSRHHHAAAARSNRSSPHPLHSRIAHMRSCQLHSTKHSTDVVQHHAGAVLAVSTGLLHVHVGRHLHSGLGQRRNAVARFALRASMASSSSIPLRLTRAVPMCVSWPVCCPSLRLPHFETSSEDLPGGSRNLS